MGGPECCFASVYEKGREIKQMPVFLTCPESKGLTHCCIYITVLQWGNVAYLSHILYCTAHVVITVLSTVQWWVRSRGSPAGTDNKHTSY